MIDLASGEQGASAGHVTLRAATPQDQELLYQVYASTREEEIAPLNWTQEQKTAFLRMQFDAQRRHYLAHYADAEYQIILRDGMPVGRLYVHRGTRDLRIMDIALLPAHRGIGIGGAILAELLSEGAATQRTVSIHVERFNPAMRLYRRLGFVEVEEQGIYLLMECRPLELAVRHAQDALEMGESHVD